MCQQYDLRLRLSFFCWSTRYLKNRPFVCNIRDTSHYSFKYCTSTSNSVQFQIIPESSLQAVQVLELVEIKRLDDYFWTFFVKELPTSKLHPKDWMILPGISSVLYILERRTQSSSNRGDMSEIPWALVGLP